MNHFSIVFILGALISTSIAAPSGDSVMSIQKLSSGKGQWVDSIKLSGTILTDDGKTVQDTGWMMVYLPAGYSDSDSYDLAVVLHGWGQKPEDWRDNTSIGSLADKNRIVLAVPAMGKTVYESRFYPETKFRWNTIPGTRWIGEVVLPYMKNRYPVRHHRKNTAIIGVSTGGRGAVVVSERYPDFGFCASVSGTYDLGILGNSEGEYKIHAKVFGSRDSFPERWKDEDCQNRKSVDALKDMTLFIAHGKKDPVVNISQMESFKRLLDARKIRYQAFAVDNEGHDWKFWDSQLPRIFELMSKSSKSESSKKE
jgi:enterochelin esterase-like enzyme